MLISRGTAAAAGLAILALAASWAPAQSVISPSLQGSIGSNGMTSGTASVIFSAPQCAVATSQAAASAIQAGFFGFLSALSAQSTAAPGVPIVQTLVTGTGQVTVSLPPDCLPPGTVISLALPASVPAPTGSLAPLTNSAVQINSGSQPNLPVTLSFSYAGASLAGLDPRQFVVARYDTGSALWVPLLSAVDTSNQVVRAQTRHFSLFQVMQQAPSSTVATARAFPNPLRPAQGDAAMTFVNLPAESRVRIYTLRGVLVKDLAANASGMASWDGTNESGAQVASGAYFVFAQGAGESRTLTVAVQR